MTSITADTGAAAAAPANRPLTREDYKTLGLSALGGTLEFYDFVVFVFFANVIGSLFSPRRCPTGCASCKLWVFLPPAIWRAPLVAF